MLGSYEHTNINLGTFMDSARSFFYFVHRFAIPVCVAFGPILAGSGFRLAFVSRFYVLFGDVGMVSISAR